jgi:SH3 domain-containing YSC84-like protein 1
MKRTVLAAALILAAALPRAQAQTEKMQALVDRSTLAMEDALTLNASDQPRVSLAHARAVLICPQVIKAGFFFAGSGGDCVLVARGGNGTWSYPAFYQIGSASFGLQIGLQDSEIVMLIMTDRGLNAVLNSNFKIGADAGVAVLNFGGGIGGGTTAAVGADILAFAISSGAYLGVSLEGSLLSQLSSWDQRYYGQPLDARQIVVAMQGANPGADPLRSMLTRYGTAAPVVASAPPYVARGTAAPYQVPPYQAPPPGYQAQGQAPVNLLPNVPVQQQTLPPPR